MKQFSAGPEMFNFLVMLAIDLFSSFRKFRVSFFD